MAPTQALSATDRATRGRRGLDEALRRLLRCPGPPSGGGGVDATQITTCTAEEMALDLVIDAAEDATGDGSLTTDLSLPASPDRDEDFDALGSVDRQPAPGWRRHGG